MKTFAVKSSISLAHLIWRRHVHQAYNYLYILSFLNGDLYVTRRNIQPRIKVKIETAAGNLHERPIIFQV